MATYKTKAIILSSYPYREHDRIITFYSEEFGKMDARARGTRKITSKLAGHLESFIETELLLANGRRWDILAGSRTLNNHYIVRSSVEKLASASVCSEAIKHITKPLSSDKRVYGLMRALLVGLEKMHEKHGQKYLVATFLWQLLGISGFRAELKNCINCRTELKEGSFSFEGGGILCDNCKYKDMLSIEIDKIILNQLKTSNLKSEESQSIAKRFWQSIVDHRPLDSLDFFETVTI
ncbi:DNA repair protein RecO [Patescibacteria group bacterium]|nr:DNA repair protein RecO [Patescibacteria group bacterium]